MMNWKERLQELRGPGRLERQASDRHRQKRAAVGQSTEALERKVRSRVEKVCKRFASTVRWRVTTDTGDFISSPSRFYVEPRLREGDDPAQGTDKRITIEIGHYDGCVFIEPPACLAERAGKTVAVAFADFDEGVLVSELERFYRSVWLMDEDPSAEPELRNDDIPCTLDLGWYWSEDKEEYQMAKIAQSDREAHMYVAGGSRTGKTKFLEFLIQQDIKNGHGLCVIDPHGDLTEDIKGFLACRYYESGYIEEITDRLVLIDPTDPQYTVAFNPLERLPNMSVAQQAGELVSAFRKIWSDAWGVRMEDLMRNSLIALGEANLALADLSRFLTQRDFRIAVLGKVDHPTAQDYFRRFDSLTDRSQLTWIEPVMNKINAFLADERIRPIFSHPKSSFNIREIMDHRKILLVKLDKGRLGGSAFLLGSLLMAKIQMAAFSRSDIPKTERIPFYLYVDEFQNFATESFGVVLSEAGKYALSLVMAHQVLEQISRELRGNILGNANIQVFFQMSHDDAQILAKEAFPYTGEAWEYTIQELKNLPKRYCYVRHKFEGGIIPIHTVTIEPASEVLGMDQREYQAYLETIPFGQKYLLPRGEMGGKVVEKPAPETKVPTEQQATKEPVDELPDALPEMSHTETKDKSKHKHLQSLIKSIAEESGYRAILEQPTPDGLGRVDVHLEKDARKIACEVCVTTDGEWELSNIEKCLVAGYDLVISCSSRKKSLTKIKSLASRRLKPHEQERTVFLQIKDFPRYLEEFACGPVQKSEDIPTTPTSEELWQERVWHAMRHLDDRITLSQNPLARLAYIERLADREFRGKSLPRGMALKKTLLACMDKIIAAQTDSQGMRQTCEFLELTKQGLNLTAISQTMGLSREHVTRHHKKKAVELVTQEFIKRAKTRKRGKNPSK